MTQRKTMRYEFFYEYLLEMITNEAVKIKSRKGLNNQKGFVSILVQRI